MARLSLLHGEWVAQHQGGMCSARLAAQAIRKAAVSAINAARRWLVQIVETSTRPAAGFVMRVGRSFPIMLARNNEAVMHASFGKVLLTC